MNDVLVNQYNLENEPRKSGCWRRVEQQHPRKDTGGEQVILGGREKDGPSGDFRSPLPAEVEALLGVAIYVHAFSYGQHIQKWLYLWYWVMSPVLQICNRLPRLLLIPSVLLHLQQILFCRLSIILPGARAMLKRLNQRLSNGLGHAPG